MLRTVASVTDYEHLTSLFENATEGIVLCNGTGNIMLANPAAERMFGYKNGEITGKLIEVLIPDHVKPHHHHLRERFYEHPSNRVMGQGRDLYGKKKDGAALPVEVSLSHYHRNDELFVIAFIVDITRRKEIEDNVKRQQEELENISIEIRKLNAELELKVEERTMILKEALQRLEQSQLELSQALNKEKQMNELKSRFVAMASHEFRTPLSTVLSSAALLAKYTASDEQDKRNRHIDKIRSSVKHLNEILEDFLSFGKLEEGKVVVHPVEFNLKECIANTLDEVKPMQKLSQRITTSYLGAEQILCDEKLVKNILINLLTNAIKFSGENGEVKVHASVNERQITLAIQDNGIGISEEDQQHLFSSFFRGGNAVNISGTGLGLTIVKRYTDLLDGSVVLKSRPNEGTLVTVTIPQASNQLI